MILLVDRRIRTARRTSAVERVPNPLFCMVCGQPRRLLDAAAVPAKPVPFLSTVGTPPPADFRAVPLAVASRLPNVRLCYIATGSSHKPAVV